MDPTIEQTINASRPAVVTRAVQLFSASFVIGAIRTVYDLAHKLSGASFVLSLVFLLIFLGICFFFVGMIAAGRNWARIVFLVLLIIGLPLALPTYIGELKASLPYGSVSILVAILQVIGIVLLFTKNSNLWFRTPK
jgi:membrane-bound ClpP family serine protease